ncbi:unnamed protein product [Ectocarpus sp. CCAP 1310/34]|nr:unnamed protein product [Ectocarpus sp. CCAP 1310/34]
MLNTATMKMPEDQFLNVLSYLVVDSVFAMSSTCRQLHEWCSLFKAVDAGEEELRNADLALLVRRFPAVNDLTIRSASRLTTAYEVLAEIGPQLVSLKLAGARIIRDDTFRDMVRTFESMRYLSLNGTFYVKSQAINALAKAGQQLQEVSLCGFRQLKDEDVQFLLDSCPSLSVLSVADCTTLGSLVLRSTQLETLDVSRCIHISEMSLETPGLTRLDANWCTKLPDCAVESLVGSCLALEHLGLKGCSALVSPTIQSAKLRSLDLSLCGKLTTCSISGPSLTTLKVAMCMGLNSLTLELPVMISLDLSMLGVKNLTLNCNKLVYANLRGSYKLESANIQSRCPGLSVVDLCGTKINPEAFVRSDGEGEGDVIQGGAPLPWHTY